MIKDLLEFIEKSPSMFHVVDNLQKMALEMGYEMLSEKEVWKLQGGGKYMLSRNGSTLALLQLPKGEPKGFHIVASHSDSPCFKIKENPELKVENKYTKLSAEIYGGMIRSSWLDRPLSVAGRVFLQEKDEAGNKKELTERLVNIDQDLCVIPNLAIHMNREVNKGYAYQPHVDLAPLFCGVEENNTSDATEQSKGLFGMLAEQLKVEETEILGHDLYLYVREKGRIFGGNGEFILSPKLDDLQCVFASAKAMLASEPEEYINLCLVFDNEEVGSGTAQGADSTFFQDVIYGIAEALSKEGTWVRRMLADSLLISADNAHAVHPNHPELADGTNRPYLNGGPVIKFHAGQKYTTDGKTAAMFKQLCEATGVPYQTYANRADQQGGSTLGNISTSHISLPSVDMGLPQLAMHSAVETAGAKDTAYAYKVLAEFYKK